MPELLTRILTAIPLIIIFVCAILYLAKWVFAALMFAILIFILLFEWPKLFSPRSLIFWTLMPFYPIAPVLLIITLHYYSTTLTLLLFAGAGIFDTSAYFVGKLWGKHKILPKVSPGKTWEGFIGGFIITVLFAQLFFFKTQNLLYTTALVLVFCFFCLAGDLFESALKRRVKIKDTGSLLPGHGGLLDRFDSVFFAVFFVYFLKNYLSP